jgi:hypothetical protein
MSRVIDLWEDSDSDDDGEWSTTTVIPPLPLSRKRPRDKEPRNENGPRDNNAAGSAEFVVDLELVDNVEVSPRNRKRRGVVKSERNVKKDAARKRAQICSDEAQVTDHRESHKGLPAAAAASHPMNSDSEQTSPDDGSTNEHSQKRSTSEPPSNASLQQCSAWRDRLSEIADYRKIHGHCNIPTNYSENTKLANWVTTQRHQYRLHLKGKRSSMTTFRIQELESLGFEWEVWVTAWEDRLSQLADYRTIHGHCNVPQRYSEDSGLARWVANQRCRYRLRLEGKPSSMTLSRIQALECLDFGWRPLISRRQKTREVWFTAWEDHLSELADYCKIHGHCNVPKNYSENTTLAKWVQKQRSQYRLHEKGERSQITLPRIQALESLSFEWQPSTNQGKGIPRKLILDDDVRRVHKTPANHSELETAPSYEIVRATGYH